MAWGKGFAIVKFLSSFRKGLACACATVVASVLFARSAEAEVTLAKVNDWEVFTQGRVNAFFSYGWGDANPVLNPNIPAESIPVGGGLNTATDSITKSG